MILLYGSQEDYDLMTGKATSKGKLSPSDFAPMYEYMAALHEELAHSGELVDAQGLSAPVFAKRLQLQNGVPVVTDGPYAETQEVLAAYTVV
jgi:hypothetical protein